MRAAFMTLGALEVKVAQHRGDVGGPVRIAIGEAVLPHRSASPTKTTPPIARKTHTMSPAKSIYLQRVRLVRRQR